MSPSCYFSPNTRLSDRFLVIRGQGLGCTIGLVADVSLHQGFISFVVGPMLAICRLLVFSGFPDQGGFRSDLLFLPRCHNQTCDLGMNLSVVLDLIGDPKASAGISRP